MAAFPEPVEQAKQTAASEEEEKPAPKEDAPRKKRTCPKAKGYGKGAQTVLTDSWDCNNLKLDYKTARDKVAVQCSYQRPLAAEGEWNEGKFVARTNGVALTLEPGKSVEVQLAAPSSTPNFLSETFPGLSLTSGCAFSAAERSRKLYVRGKYQAAPALQLGGQLSFSPARHEADGWEEHSTRPAVLLNEAKVTAAYSTPVVNLGATLSGLTSVSVDFACAPAEVLALFRGDDEGQVHSEKGAMDLFVGGNTSYSLRTHSFGPTTLAGICQASGGFVSLAAGNALRAPDYTLTTATPLGDWTLAAKMQWKQSSGGEKWMPATCYVGASCKLDGGSKIRFRVSHDGDLGLSYAARAPKDKLALSFSAETSMEGLCGLELPRVGVSLKWG